MWNKRLSKSFLTPTVGREVVLKGAIRKIIGRLQGKNILDLGCGSGYWTRFFRSRGAHCIGVDVSPEQIKLAKSFNTRGIDYVVSDIAAFNPLKRFDVVFIDHVISETSSPKKAVQILERVRELLKKNGFMLLNEVHPSIANFPFRKLKAPKNYHYFQSAAPLTFRVKQMNGRSVTLHDYHWTLQDFSSFLQKAGFFIEKIIEPRPENLKSLDALLRKKCNYPSHIIIKAFVK